MPVAGNLGRVLLERLAAADPGLNRLRLSVRVVGGVGVAMAVSYGLSHLAGRADVVSMVVSALVALQLGFSVNDGTAVRQLVSTFALTVVYTAALLMGTALHGHRALSLVVLCAMVFVGAWVRRFGTIGVGIGMMAWMGDFIGFYLGPEVGGYRWELMAVGAGAIGMAAVSFGLFWPRPAQALRRTQRSFLARVKAVAEAATEVLLVDQPGGAGLALERLHRSQDRLNETALMITAQLATPAALPEGTSAQLLHQRLFDAELSIQTVARMAERLVGIPGTAALRRRVAEVLVGVRAGDVALAAQEAQALGDRLSKAERRGTRGLAEGDPANAALYRLAGALAAWAEATSAWLALADRPQPGARTVPLRPTVELVSGYLPGSASLTAAVVESDPAPLARRLRLRPTTRLAVQMTMAVGLAIVVGDAISGRRFYWAALAAFLAFFGTNTSGEQVTKAFNRILGTALGLGTGIFMAHLVGDRVHVALAVSLACLLLGIYFMRVSYAIFVIGLVTMLGQVYVVFGEFTNALLFLRLLETAVGAVIAMAVAVVVFPVRTDRAVEVALSEALRRLDTFLSHVGGRLDRPEDVSQLRQDARMLDQALWTLSVTARPLSRTLMGTGSDRITGQLARISALRHYAANLAHFAESATFDPTTMEELGRIVGKLRTSIAAVDPRAERAPGDCTYRRVAGELDALDRRLSRGHDPAAVNDARMVLHFVGLIDDTLAEVAASRGLAVPGDEFVWLARGRRGELMATAGAGALEDADM